METTTAQGFTADEDKRVFLFNGARVPSVTEVLGGVGIINTQYSSEEAMVRGRNVHLLTEHFDLGDHDDEYAKANGYDGYVAAWAKFRADHAGLTFTSTEARLFSPVLMLCGKPDRVGLVDGRPVVLDIKTGPCQPWHKLQLALLVALLGTPHERWGVHIKADGSYKVKTYTDRRDHSIAMACLTLYNFKKNEGYK